MWGENIYEERRINNHPRKDRGMTSDGLVMGKGKNTWPGYGEGITRQNVVETERKGHNMKDDREKDEIPRRNS